MAAHMVLKYVTLRSSSVLWESRSHLCWSCSYGVMHTALSLLLRNAQTHIKLVSVLKIQRT